MSRQFTSDPDNVFWESVIGDLFDEYDLPQLPQDKFKAFCEAIADAGDNRSEAIGEPGWGNRFAELREERDRTVKALVKEVEDTRWAVVETAAEFLRCKPTDVERVQTINGTRWVSR
jgi:hypothetical protein